jgi:hypothetical protein
MMMGVDSPVAERPGPSARTEAGRDEALLLLALEAKRLAHDGDVLQTRLGSLALRSAEPGLVEDLLAIDSLVTRLLDFADRLERIGGDEADGGDHDVVTVIRRLVARETPRRP